MAEHGQNADDFSLLVRVGMTPAAAIRAATLDAATVLDRVNHLGSIEPGKVADLIAVAASPLNDVTELRRIRFVMRRGIVHKLDGARQVMPVGRSASRQRCRDLVFSPARMTARPNSNAWSKFHGLCTTATTAGKVARLIRPASAAAVGSTPRAQPLIWYDTWPSVNVIRAEYARSASSSRNPARSRAVKVISIGRKTAAGSASADSTTDMAPG